MTAEDRQRLERLAQFCRQTATDGVLPSLAWFEEVADELEALVRAGGVETPPEMKKDSPFPVSPEVRPTPDFGSGQSQGEVYHDEMFSDWVPEFTVWIVRRGSRHPMAIDSIFTHEESARNRAKLLGSGEGWKAEKYSHLRAPSRGAVEAPAQEPLIERARVLAEAVLNRDSTIGTLLQVQARRVLHAIQLRSAPPAPPPATELQDDESRCAVCGWALAASVEKGCVRGNCSLRPLPKKAYAPMRADDEYGISRWNSPLCGPNGADDDNKNV